MSVHYLIDPFTTAGTILDVTVPKSGQTPATGALVLRVPDGAPISGNPGDLNSLLIAKSSGLLALYSGFSAVESDPCLNGGVDPANSSRVMIGGGVSQHCILAGGTLVTTSRHLSRVPSQCLVTWEAYSFSDQDPFDSRFTRQYVEQPANVLTCEIAFDGTPYRAVADGMTGSIPLANQGDDVVLRFKNNGASRVYLGSWSVLY